MSRDWIRAFVSDFDGTLTMGGPPNASLLERISCLRNDEGIVSILVTGRFVSELLDVFPPVFDYFDAVVGENGAVLAQRDGSGVREELLVAPLDPSICDRLRHRGLSVRQGRVILDMFADDEAVAAEELTAHGADCQLVRNRGALMVIPFGVSKASGLLEALRGFGLSRHNVIAFGDAENDAPLLAVSEFGVTVSNAQQAAIDVADIMLESPNGKGISEFLDARAALPVAMRQWSQRHRCVLGVDAGGRQVTVPSSQFDLVIRGASGSGKSYYTGLLAEQLIAQDYSVLILDPEGDHDGLLSLPGVGMLQFHDSIEHAEVLRAFEDPAASVVVRMQGAASSSESIAHLLDAVNEFRRRTGRPHWVFVDEAHNLPLKPRPELFDRFAGTVFTSYLTDALPSETVWTGAEPDGALTVTGNGKAVYHARGAAPVEVWSLDRLTSHSRHAHKYDNGGMSPEHWFYLRDEGDHLVGRAASLSELADRLRSSNVSVFRHHARHGDISAWVRDTIRDAFLANEIAVIEGEVVNGYLRAQAGEDRLVELLTHRVKDEPVSFSD